jgi:hypothetical protein
MKKTILLFLILSVPLNSEAITLKADTVTATSTMKVPGSTTLPATCDAGPPAEVYIDTNATSGQRLYLCESTNTWKLQGDGAGGGSGSMTTVKEADTPVGGADIVTLDFGAGFDVAESPDTEIQISLDLTEKQVNLATEVTGTLPNANVAEDLTITGGSVDNTTTITLEEQGAADPTIDGRIEWDSTTETLKVGDDGVATLEFQPGAHTTDTTLNLAGAETITGNWVNTATPWADNEVVDTITASNYLPLAGGTMTGALVSDEQGVEFLESDDVVTCAAGDYWLRADLSETVLKKCENGSETVMDTTGGNPATEDISDVSVTQTEFAELETIGATTISANQWAALGGIAETLSSTELNLLDGITTLSGSNTGDNDEVGTKTTGDLCVNDGSSVNCTVNTEAEFETAMDALNFIVSTEIDTEAELYGLLGDVTNFLQTGDALAGDDITDGSVDASELATSSVETAEILDGTILEADLKAVDTAADEECLTYETTTGDFEWQACGGGGATDTTQRFPIQLKNPQVSSLAGNSFWTTTALTAYDLGHWEFLKDVDGIVTGSVNIPNSLCSTPAAKIILQVLANATTGVTSLDVSTAAIADGESMNPASLTAETIQDVTVPGTAYLRKEVSFTLTNTPVAADTLIVEILHDGDKAADTLAVNTLLESAQLEICVSN